MKYYRNGWLYAFIITSSLLIVPGMDAAAHYRHGGHAGYGAYGGHPGWQGGPAHVHHGWHGGHYGAGYWSGGAYIYVQPTYYYGGQPCGWVPGHYDEYGEWIPRHSVCWY